jgi:hypothetical protein
MPISQLLRNSAIRFNQAADAVCLEYSQAIASTGISCPSDRTEFERLVKAKLAQSQIVDISTAEKLAA